MARQHFGDVAVHLHQRDVERPAPEVIDQHGPFALTVGAIGQRRGGRLVEDAHDFEASDLSSVARGLALRVREIGRHRDHRPLHRHPERRFSAGLKRAQNQR